MYIIYIIYIKFKKNITNFKYDDLLRILLGFLPCEHVTTKRYR